MLCQICDKGRIEICTLGDNDRLVGIKVEFGRITVCTNPDCSVGIITGKVGSVFRKGGRWFGVQQDGTLCPIGMLVGRVAGQKMTTECQHDRHDAVTLVAGQSGGEGGLFCLEGKVMVCTVCRKLLSGEEGSEYLHGRARLRVMEGGFTYIRTLG